MRFIHGKEPKINLIEESIHRYLRLKQNFCRLINTRKIIEFEYENEQRPTTIFHFETMWKIIPNVRNIDCFMASIMILFISNPQKSPQSA